MTPGQHLEGGKTALFIGLQQGREHSTAHCMSDYEYTNSSHCFVLLGADGFGLGREVKALLFIFGPVSIH